MTAETGSTYATSPAHCFGEAYVYDNAATGEFGNLTNINVASTAYNGCTQESLSLVANSRNQVTSFSYDASGNVTNDGTNTYEWFADGHVGSAHGVGYFYDTRGNRIIKSGTKWYWYGLGSQVLDESDTSGNITDEYVYFGNERVAHRVVSGNSIYYYGSDMLGTSRTIFTSAGALCYDADFYPFGGERAYTNTCAQNYKFEGKERDTETNNDNFDARYYSSQFGRWISPDWSSIPSPVPYANLNNPQTLNLYAMVSDNPETFADLDGHLSGTFFMFNFAQVDDNPVFADMDYGVAFGQIVQEEGQNPSEQQVSLAQNQAQQQNNDRNQQNNQDQNQQNQHIQMSGGKGKGKGKGSGPGKGERKITGKPEYKPQPAKPPKGWRQLPDGR